MGLCTRVSPYPQTELELFQTSVIEVACYKERVHAPETRETYIFLTEHFGLTC
jgi:hypothetical protein